MGSTGTEVQISVFSQVSKDIEALKGIFEKAKQHVTLQKDAIDSLDTRYKTLSTEWESFKTEDAWNGKNDTEKIKFSTELTNLLQEASMFLEDEASEKTFSGNNGWTALVVGIVLLLLTVTAIKYHAMHRSISTAKPSPGMTIGDSAETAGENTKPQDTTGDTSYLASKATENRVTDRCAFFRLLGSSMSSLSRPEPDFRSARSALDSIGYLTSDPLVNEYAGQLAFLGGLCTGMTNDSIYINIKRRNIINKDTVIRKQMTDSIYTEDSAKAADSAKTAHIASKTQAATRIYDQLTAISKESILVGNDDRYFWAIGPKRWLEIYFWALFGVFAGILKWISSSKENGIYSLGRIRREWPWYLTEIVAGPLVIMVFFFIAGKATASMVEGITATEIKTSIQLTMGIAFVLGFYTRRAFELLLSFANYLKFKSPSNT